MEDEFAQTRKLYEKVIAASPGVEGKGKLTKWTSKNGHMYSFVTQEGGVALRLPAAEQEAFLEKYKTTIVIQYGAVMRGYVLVPPSLLKRTAELAKHFAVSVKHIASLPPKPTTKPKKKAGKAAGKARSAGRVSKVSTAKKK